VDPEPPTRIVVLVRPGGSRQRVRRSPDTAAVPDRDAGAAMLGCREMRAVVAPAGVRLALIAAAAAGACQRDRTAPPPAAGSARPAPAAAASRGPAEPPAAVPAHVRLPRSPDAPIAATRRPLERDQLDRLVAVEFADFERRAPDAYKGLVEVRHTTRSRPRLGVAVIAGPCSEAAACPAIEPAAWTARRDELLRQLPEALRAHPDTRLDIAPLRVAGAAAIGVFELGYASQVDDHDQPAIDYIDAFVIHYNDGVNQLRVTASYADDAGGIDQLLALAPREDLERLATAFASYYLHAWNG
jgi:hypothetical protein